MEEKNDELLNVTNLMNSLQDVESYIITDFQGKIYKSSQKNFDETLINTCLYLLTIGSNLGNSFNIGVPTFVFNNLKSRKTTIFKYEEFVIILNLKEVSKYFALKQRIVKLFGM
jgi:hypothetical protein